MQWQLFKGDVPHVSTFAYHEHRDRAPHIDQSEHQPRMRMALEFVKSIGAKTMLDLGCGDGGFIQMAKNEMPWLYATGFDFTPDMVEGWSERGLEAVCFPLDVFPPPPHPVMDPEAEYETGRVDVTVMTEILEHLARPHKALALVRSKHIIVSSPWGETDRHHDPSHAWAWDWGGYEKLVEDAGFIIVEHEEAGFSQVILARR